MTESERQRQEKICTRVNKVWKNESKRWAPEFDAYDKGWPFLGGEQYSKIQPTYFEKIRRPANVFNLTLPIFNQLFGEFLLTQTREKVHPFKSCTKEIAEIFEDVLDQIAIENDEECDES